jgi:hypothetical protein
MALTFPRDIFLEMFLNDAWQVVTSYVRQTSPIQLGRGRGNEQGEVAPGSLACKLENGTGNFTPANPLGAYYGSIKKGTSVRYGITAVNDTFARTVSNGWGSATTGEVWTANGGSGGSVLSSDWNVAGGAATHSVPTTSAYRYSTLGITRKNVEVACTTTVPVTNITGGPIEPCNLIVRHDGASTYYMTRVSIDASEVLVITLYSVVAGVETQLLSPVTVSGLVDSATNKVIRVKMQAEGNTVRAKVYAVGAEPSGWHVSINTTAISAAGVVGVRNGIGAGNTNTKPIVFSNDDFTVRDLRFAGEIVELKPRWNTTHSDQWAEMTAGTALRRIRQGKNPVKSSMVRGYLADGIDSPVQYWPCEEGKDARQFNSAVDTQPLLVTSGNPRPAEFGDFLSSSPFPVVNGSTWVGQVSPPSTANTSGQVRFFIAVPAGGHQGGTAALADIYLNHPSGFRFRLNYLAGGDFSVQTFNTVGTKLYDSGTLSFGINGKLYRIGLGLVQNAGDIQYEVVRLDYATGFNGAVGPTTAVAGTFTSISRVVIAPDATVTDIAIGQVVVQSNLTSVSELSSEFRAWIGETPINRFARLCRENGVGTLGIQGSSSPHKMGPQAPTLLANLLKECQDTIQGTLYDSRMSGNTLMLRTINTTYAQDTRLTLSYTNHEIAEPFQPASDDRPIRNDITAKRSSGGEFRVTQDTGPNNTQDPGADDDAVGRYDQQYTANTWEETQLPNIAGWELHLGTTEAERWPKLRLNMRAASLVTPAKQGAILDLELDDRITVTGLDINGYYDDIELIVRGYTETYDTAYGHTIEFNCAPYDPYAVAVFGSSASRWDTANSDLTSGITSTATSFQIDVNKGELWTTSSSQFPMEVMLGGERVRLSAISGSSSPQTATVDTGGRSVNGVVKAHSAGAKISVASPVYYGR